MRGGGRSCEIYGWMDGFALGGRLGGGEVGFDWRGVGWNDIFCFFCFSAGLKWILLAVGDVA